MKRLLRIRLARPFTFCYVDESGTQNDGGGGGTDSANDGGGSGGNDSANTDPPPPAPVGDPNDPITRLKFTPDQQKFLNDRLAAERKKLQTANEKNIAELKKLQAAQGTTMQQKQELQRRIDEMQEQFMSKEELARKEKERLQKEYQSDREKLAAERDMWKGNYTQSTIERAITDSATRLDAFNAEQIVSLLIPNTRLVEQQDEAGNPNGKFLPRVKFQDNDTEGKPIILDLTVPEAVKRMKDLPERFGNLFKSGVSGGLGQNGSANRTGRGSALDPSKMTTEQYMKARKENQNKPPVGTR